MMGTMGRMLLGGAAGGFDPLSPPESSVDWVWVWDTSEADTITLSGGTPNRVTLIEDLLGDSARGGDADGANLTSEWIASWRNGLPALKSASNAYMQMVNNAVGLGPQPLTVVVVGEFIPNDNSEAFRILINGLDGGADATPLYCERVSGSTFALKTFAGTVVTHNSDVSAWWGLPFVGCVTLNGASSRLDLHFHGLAPVTYASFNPGTRSMNNIRWGCGLLNGAWNAPQAQLYPGLGVISAIDRDYMIAGFKSMYDIVTV